MNHNFHSSGTKQKIDHAIDILYAGGVNNPMDAIEQISYLLFLKILTEKHKGRSGSLKKCSWDYLIPLGGEELTKSVRDAIETIHQLPEISQTGKLLFSKATLKILDAAALKAVMMEIDSLSSELISGADIKGDAYEYLLKQLSASGTNGQFRTPRHIIDLIVKLVDPKVGDTICDPACGTGGFLIAAYDHILSSNTPDEAKEAELRIHGSLLKAEDWDFLKEKAIWGLDNDLNMVKISTLNLYLHKLPKAKIHYHNTIANPFAGGYGNQKFSVILANPPFAGKVQQGSIQEDLCSGFKSRATELLFLKWIIDHLEEGGRAGVIVPNGVLFGSSKAHKSIRQTLLEKCSLESVISMPSGVFKPYSGVSTSLLILEKGKPTEKVWFYEMTADGFSLDDKRSPIESNDIPLLLDSWKNKATTEKSICVFPKEIKENGFILSMNLYRKTTSKVSDFPAPQSLIKDISIIQKEIASKLSKLNRTYL